MARTASATPKPFVVYSGVVFGLAIVVAVVSWKAMPPVWSWQMLLLIVAVLLSENYALDLPHVGSASLAYPLTLAAAVLLGPSSAMVVAAFGGANLNDVRDRRPLSIIVMNTGQVVLSAGLSAWSYVAIGGRILLPGGIDFTSPHPVTGAEIPWLLLPLLVAALVGFVANGLFLSIALSLFSGVSPLDVWREGLLWTAPTQFALAIVGLMIAAVLAASPVGFMLFVLPLVVARNVYRNYADMKATYGGAVRTLVTLLETKDPYTRGHSERVASYSGSLGKSMGLSASQLEQLDHASLLHDIGKLRIRAEILTKPGSLSPEEYADIRQHPSAGVRLISKIPHVEQLGSLVRSHHEQFDGRGYPDGLRGDEIPLMARILAVADAYDAMTTARPYRPPMTPDEACAEITRCSGSQFDPDIAAAWQLMHERGELELRVNPGTVEVAPIAES